MTYEGVLGIIVAVVAFLITVDTPLIKLLRSIDGLKAEMTLMRQTLQDLNERNSEAHSRMGKEIDRHEAKLEDHDKRISALEVKTR